MVTQGIPTENIEAPLGLLRQDHSKAETANNCSWWLSFFLCINQLKKVSCFWKHGFLFFCISFLYSFCPSLSLISDFLSPFQDVVATCNPALLPVKLYVSANQHIHSPRYIRSREGSLRNSKETHFIKKGVIARVSSPSLGLAWVGWSGWSNNPNDLIIWS